MKIKATLAVADVAVAQQVNVAVGTVSQKMLIEKNWHVTKIAKIKIPRFSMNPNSNCRCRKCLEGAVDNNGLPVLLSTFVVCAICGNKRCPKATDHALDCTNSNAPGQKGSVWENYKI